jgi:hypothetical protein
MAAAVPQLLEEAGKQLGALVADIGKNYLKGLVAEAFQPAIQDGIKQALEDAKEEAGLGGPEETPVTKLAYNKDEKERDTFIVNVTESQVRTPALGAQCVTYDTYVVRIGSTGDEKEKEFYVNAQFFNIRYRHLAVVPDKLKKDFKDAKVPAFPAPYQIGGTCCFCITKQPGDKRAHDEAMHVYFGDIFKAVGYSKQVADHFRVGDNWEIQQTAKQIFFDALTNTVADQGIDNWNPEIEPFNEVEAITEFLKAYAIGKILPKITDPIEAEGLPPIVKNRAIEAARSGLATAIEGASGAWEPLQGVATKAGEAATKHMKEAAEKIVESLKPVIAKVVGIVKEKMKKKAEEKGGDEGKELEEKDKKVEIGDIVSEWKFEKTPIGRKLYENLTKETPAHAIRSSSEEIQSKLREAVRGPIESVVEIICGAKFVIDPWTQWQIWWMARRVTNFITEITTLEGFLEAAAKLAEAVTPLEEEFAKAAGKKEELDKLADKASSVLWQTLAEQAVTLWTKIYQLNEKIESVFSGQPDEVKQPLYDLLSHIFEVQVRGFNAIRVLYSRKLKESLGDAGDAEAAKAASRTALRDAIYEVVGLLAIEHWTKTHEALTEAAKAYVLNRFTNEIWPSIKSGLDELQSLLPSQVADAGLDIAGLALKIATIIINKGVEWGMKKVGLKLEAAIFGQEESGE